MSEQDRRLIAREREHRFKIPRKVLEAVVAIRWRSGLSQARFVPDNQSKPVRKVSFEVIPFTAVQAPAVSEDDRSAILGP